MMLPNVFYILNTISIKGSADFFVKIGRPMLKFIYKLKEFRIDKLILKRIDKTETLTVCDFNTYCKATVSKTTWYWHNDI